VEFINFPKLNFVRGKFLKIWLSINRTLGSRKAPHKIWSQSVQPFWRLLDTNKQTDRQAKYIIVVRTFFLQFYRLFPLDKVFMHHDQKLYRSPLCCLKNVKFYFLNLLFKRTFQIWLDLKINLLHFIYQNNYTLFLFTKSLFFAIIFFKIYFFEFFEAL